MIFKQNPCIFILRPSPSRQASLAPHIPTLLIVILSLGLYRLKVPEMEIS